MKSTTPWIAILLLAAGDAAACDGLRVDDAWIRSAPPGSRVLVGYATLVNAGKAPIAVERATSDAFGAVEMHETLLEHGLSRMRRLLKLEIPAGRSAEFKPGGKHLMLFRPQRDLADGDTVDFRFQCGGSELSAPFTVKTPPEPPNDE
ncbi:MAG: copper chaperone PCu(A)C [Gammaproteobacteria bacterium]|nr:copper chaperone PCu(A)C [Gammaproteobacteria bacterium]